MVPGEVCTKRSERGNRDHEATLNVQKSAEAIVAERRRAESVGVLSTTGKGGTAEMAENLEYKSCPQKDSAEHESYAGAPRLFAPDKEGTGQCIKKD